METCEEQTFLSLEGGSQFCPLAFPASRAVLPGSGEARMMSVGSGVQCSMLLEGSSRLGVFSKILLGSSHWTSSEEFCYVWNRLDTRFGLSAFQLTPLGQSIDGSGCSLWPTPNAGNFNDGENLETWEARREKNKAKGINGNGQGTPLAIAAKLFPTPTVPNGGRRNREGTSITGRKPDGGKAQIDLREYAIRLLPTPQAHDAAKGDPKRVGRFGTKHGGRNLNDEVMLYPTPTAQDGANNAGPSQMKRDSLSLNATIGGSLNPRFVEQLQGFPIDHTALKRLEMQSCRNRRTRSLRRSRKLKSILGGEREDE
jgi:hypothetical protein